MKSDVTSERSGRTGGSFEATGKNIDGIDVSFAEISASCAVTSASTVDPIAHRDPEVALVVAAAAVDDNRGLRLNV